MVENGWPGAWDPVMTALTVHETLLPYEEGSPRLEDEFRRFVCPEWIVVYHGKFFFLLIAKHEMRAGVGNVNRGHESHEHDMSTGHFARKGLGSSSLVSI